MSRVIVIGGGAAGLMAAIAAAECGAEVVLLEKNEKLGKKLYITGKGRCNVTNACDREDFFAHMVSNPRFLYSSYSKWNNWDMADYLESLGLPLKTERGNRVFPASDKSSDVIRTLQRAAERAGVRCRLNTPVASLQLEEDPQGGSSCRGVILESGERCAADAVIVATGGLSYPSTGSTGDGYRFSREAGHTVTECFPALVPLEAVFADGSSCREVQGLTLKNVSIDITEGKKKLADGFGELLFTHFGVSGPLILTASSRVTSRLNGGTQAGGMELRIDLKPALTEEQLERRFLRELEAGANRQMKNVLLSLFPSGLVPVILRLGRVDPGKCAREITRAERRRLEEVTKALPLKILGTRGFPEAVITQGGVSVSEIRPATMESKRTGGLYFAGEVIDVDACTGGYNLQIAWSTGHAAGCAAAGAGEE